MTLPPRSAGSTDSNISVVDEHGKTSSEHDAFVLDRIVALVNHVFPDRQGVPKTIVVPSSKSLEECLEDYRVRAGAGIASSPFVLGFAWVGESELRDGRKKVEGKGKKDDVGVRDGLMGPPPKVGTGVGGTAERAGASSR